jgi:subtilisin family serine protease
MQRVYFPRGRRVVLDQVEGVLAIQISTDQGGARRSEPEEFGRPIRSGPEDRALLAIHPAVVDAFARANWSFIVPTPETRRAFQQRSLPDTIAAAGPVFRREDGQVVVGTDSMTVKLRPELATTEAMRALAAAGLQIIRPLRFAPNLFEVRVTAARDALDTSVALHENPAFEYGEPVLIEPIGGRFVPTDPKFGEQWQWRNDGSGDGVAGADVGAVAAWDFTRGADVRLAVIDNGFDVAHADLRAGIVNTSGYFDRTGVFHRTLVDYPPDSADHGTFCAGMAAARANNGVGGCGAAPECDLMLVAALADQVGSQVTLARAVAYCADPSTEDPDATGSDGAHVISCSLGPSISSAWTLSSVLDDAIRFAATNGRGGLGTVIFWACSNGHDLITNDEVVSHPLVVAVGRANRRNLPDQSAFGPELGLLAPGADVFSTRSSGLYGTKVGTSFAAPCAAGVAALILAVNPTLSLDALRTLLRTTATKIGGGYDANGHSDEAGYGLINGARAVAAAGDGSRPQPGESRAPTISAPAVVLRSAPPTFQIDAGGAPFYAVEVARAASLFNPAATGSQRTPDNFYATWQEPESFLNLPQFQLPPTAWSRLAVGARIFYRVWANGSSSTWLNPVPSTPSRDYQQARFSKIAPAIEAPPWVSRADSPVFEVEPSPFVFYAVEVATAAELFHPTGTGVQRDETNFYATWQDPPSFFTQPMYQLPALIWDRLKAADRLYYRVWANARATAWQTPIPSTPSSQYQTAPFFDIVP